MVRRLTLLMAGALMGATAMVAVQGGLHITAAEAAGTDTYKQLALSISFWSSGGVTY